MSALSLVLSTGCSGLPWLMYMTSDEKVSAEFKLPPGPLVILVDDYLDVVQPPLAREALLDALSEELRKQELATQITTKQELAQARKADREFDKRSIREVGRLVKAETMIWINPQEYEVDDDVELAHTDARFSVQIKVFDVTAEEESKIRLWPGTRFGQSVRATVSAHDVRQCKSRTEVHHKVATALADQVAKLFYEYKIEK